MYLVPEDTACPRGLGASGEVFIRTACRNLGPDSSRLKAMIMESLL